MPVLRSERAESDEGGAFHPRARRPEADGPGATPRRTRLWPLPRPLRAGLFCAATAALLWLSLAPTRDLPGAVMFWDKAEHSLAYLVLTGMGLVLFPRHPRLLAAYVMAVGGGVEVLQAVMGFGRQGDWRDILANAIGIAAAYSLAALARLRPGR